MSRQAAWDWLRVGKVPAIGPMSSLHKSAAPVLILLLWCGSLASAQPGTTAQPEPDAEHANEATLGGNLKAHDHRAAACDHGLTTCDHGLVSEGCGASGCGHDPACGSEHVCHGQLMPSFGRLQVRGEYLLWWTQGSGVGPLVTTSPIGTPRDQAGVIGQDSSILFGDAGLTDEARSGGRITMTWWLQPQRHSAIEATYLGLGRETTVYRGASDGDPILARPFFGVRDGAGDSRLIAFEDVSTGSLIVDAGTELQGVEVLMRRALFRRPGFRTDVLFGYRFNRLDDDLLITESTVSTDPLSSGTLIDLFDRFDTRNHFHGVELGVGSRGRHRRWTLEMLIKLALGNTHSRVLIDGSTATTVPGVDPVISSGGLLALPTNMGVFEDSHFTMIPELGVTLGYDLTGRLRATFGYTLLYWSRVARPGDQIDFDVNDSQLSGGTLDGAPRPEFSQKTDDFWAQGMSFGLEYRY